MLSAISNQTVPLYLANKPLVTDERLTVLDKYSGERFAEVSLANEALVNQAIAAASAARLAMQSMKPFERQQVLNQCTRQFEERSEEFARVLCAEAGKPIKDARGEVQRLIDTFRVAAEESVRIDGQVLNLEISPRAAGYHGFCKRLPVGVCAFISPFNFPLNLVAHKVAPAIAAGCPFVLKPASRTPVSALLIAEVLSECPLPAGAFSVLPCSRESGELLVTDDRISLLSFTGSAKVGWAIKQRCGKKKVVLELGGNAACIVHEDANLADVVQRLIVGAFYQSGQSCISVQRILVHQKIYEPLKELLVAGAQSLKLGDPSEESTFIGPIISIDEAIRLERWVQEAVSHGATLLCGGQRQGALMAATLLENVPADLPLCSEEAFGPVAILQPYEQFQDAIALANSSRYGLQVGIFTNDLHRMLYAWERMEVGGVVINDVPSWRVDNMPYGGVKDSGLGREGVRSAIDDMSEPRMLIVRSLPQRDD